MIQEAAPGAQPRRVDAYVAGATLFVHTSSARGRQSPIELMPHGYTSHTTRDGPVVTKAYRGPDATQRCARETAMLRRLAGLVPVPPVVASTDISLSLGFMPGVHGQDLIAAGLGGQVLHACGQVLRRIHALDPGLAPGLAPAGQRSPARAVLVHGDFGPNNVLLDQAGQEITAVLDWEWAHAGDPVEDLAWCEWIMRMHHPRDAAASTGSSARTAARPPGRHARTRCSPGAAPSSTSASDGSRVERASACGGIASRSRGRGSDNAGTPLRSVTIRVAHNARVNDLTHELRQR